MRYALMALAVVLAGCSSGGNWVKDPAMSDLEKAKGECQARAAEATEGVVTVYEGCMAAKGYRKE